MDPATIAILIKLAPYILQGAGVVVGNVHQDVLGYQSVLIAQQVTQQEYYRTLRAYYQMQGRKGRKRK